MFGSGATGNTPAVRACVGHCRGRQTKLQQHKHPSQQASKPKGSDCHKPRAGSRVQGDCDSCPACKVPVTSILGVQPIPPSPPTSFVHCQQELHGRSTVLGFFGLSLLERLPACFTIPHTHPRTHCSKCAIDGKPRFQHVASHLYRAVHPPLRLASCNTAFPKVPVLLKSDVISKRNGRKLDEPPPVRPHFPRANLKYALGSEAGEPQRHPSIAPVSRSC